MKEKARLALLISGTGSTARKIIKVCHDGTLEEVDPVLIIASKEMPNLIMDKRPANVALHVVDRDALFCSSAFGECILKLCKKHRVDIIGQYGWMPKTPPEVIDAYPNRMINQHLGPLDPGHLDFGGKGMFGKRVHAARLHFTRIIGRDYWTEATAQYVAHEFDKGDVIARQRLAIKSLDSAVVLNLRMKNVEVAVQVDALRLMSKGLDVPLVRSERLVRSNEEDILAEAKRYAAFCFPEG